MTALVSSFLRAPILSSLNHETRLEIERASDEKLYPRRHVIYKADHRNDYVYLLLSGRVKLVRTSPTGRELILALIGPHDIFGESGLFDSDSHYGESAEVIEDTVVSVIDRKTLSNVVESSVASLRAYGSLQDRRRRIAESRLADHVFYDVTRRVARLLVQLASEHGRVSKTGSLIRIKLTHQELANLVGSTRETTTLILNDFRRRSLIDFSGRRIIVCDLDALAQIA